MVVNDIDYDMVQKNMNNGRRYIEEKLFYVGRMSALTLGRRGSSNTAVLGGYREKKT